MAGQAKLTAFFAPVAPARPEPASAGDCAGAAMPASPAKPAPLSPPRARLADADDAAPASPSPAPSPAASPPRPFSPQPSPSPPRPRPATDDGAAYEAERAARIAANAARLAALGVVRAADAFAGAAAPKRRRAVERAKKADPVPEHARRRSTRGKGGAGGGGDASAAAPPARPPSPPPVDYDDDTVLRYVLAAEDGDGAAAGDEAVPTPSWFRRAALALAAPPLLRAYSVAFSPAAPLLAAGGKDGVVCVWGVAGLGPGSARDAGDESDGGAPALRPPLAAAKLHRSWVADVALVAGSTGGGPLLLTAANDGAAAVWALGALAARGAPRRLGGDDAPHGGAGIFSLDAGAGGVATCAKDGSLRVAALDPSSGALAAVASWPDAHAGVAKCVRWCRDGGGGALLATTGNDGAARVWDARVPPSSSPAVEIADALPSAGNVVRWKPGSATVLLAAGAGPDTPIFDLRAPSAPAALLRGPAGAPRASAIYQPAFVGAAGDAVAVGLPKGGVLSVFDAATGAPRSRGDAGHDVATLAPGPGGLLVAAGARRLHLFAPVA